MKIYRTDWRTAIVFIVILIGWVASTWFESVSIPVFIQASLMMTVLLTVVVLLITWFSYVSISGTTLKYVWLLFSRRTIDINSITEINDQPTFKLAKGKFRSLYIFYKDEHGNAKWIEFRITIFPEKTLGKLIKDLKEINPRIELNKYADKLMQAIS